MMADCPYPGCEAQISESERQCSICGGITLICPACKAANRIFARFCRICGNLLPQQPGWGIFKGSPSFSGYCPESQAPNIKLNSLWDLNLSVNVDAPILFYNDIVVVCSSNGNIFLINGANGNLIANVSCGIGESIFYAPAICYNRLLIPCLQKIYSFSLSSLSLAQAGNRPNLNPVPILELEGDEKICCGLNACGEMFFTLSQMENDGLYYLHIIHGWDKTKRGFFPIDSNRLAYPVTDGEYIYVLDDKGFLTLFHIENMKKYWAQSLNLQVDTRKPPAVANGYLYFVDNSSENKLHCCMLDNENNGWECFSVGIITQVNSFSVSHYGFVVGDLTGFKFFDSSGMNPETPMAENVTSAVQLDPILFPDRFLVIDQNGILILFLAGNMNDTAKGVVGGHNFPTGLAYSNRKVCTCDTNGRLKCFSME